MSKSQIKRLDMQLSKDGLLDLCVRQQEEIERLKTERDEALRRLGECIKGLRQLEGAESAGVRLHVQRVLESVVDGKTTKG